MMGLFDTEGSLALQAFALAVQGELAPAQDTVAEIVATGLESTFAACSLWAEAMADATGADEVQVELLFLDCEGRPIDPDSLGADAAPRVFAARFATAMTNGQHDTARALLATCPGSDGPFSLLGLSAGIVRVVGMGRT